MPTLVDMPDYRTAYTDIPDADRGPAVSRVERLLVADTLRAVGPDQPTLCEGWTTHHLAAHLKIREGNPLDEARNILSGDAAVASAVRHQDFEALVRRVESGPPALSIFRLPKLEPILNSLEFYIHHEDVRRAQADWKPRELPSWAQDQLWRATLGATKFALRKEKVGVTLARTDTGETADVKEGPEGAGRVVLRGLASELILYLYGRRDVADIEITGPDDAVDIFTRADRGV
jgi:uncharacterized protein (TIGR03085 family)